MIGVLALALGFFASVYVYKSLQSKSSSGIENGVDVLSLQTAPARWRARSH